MTVPDISKILNKAKEVYDATHEQWLNSDVVGINITLYYPPRYEECPNCEFSTYGDGTSTVYKAGGPAPYTLGSCPLCGSASCKKEVEVTEIVKLRIYSIDSTSFTRSTMKKLGISIDQPQGELLTIGRISDLPKIKGCNYAVFYSDQEAKVGSLRYKLSTEPTPHGFGKDKYFYCFWSRV